MVSPQALSEHDRRLVAAWAADCAERVLPLFEAEAPDDDRPRDAIARARAFSRGELDAAGEIRRRFVANRATQVVSSPAAKAAAWAAGQAAGVAHMGAHALGAAAYAAKAAALASPDGAEAAGVASPDGAEAAALASPHGAEAAALASPEGGGGGSPGEVELAWQLAHLTDPVRAALRQLPLLGTDPSGPLGSGLLASGVLGANIRALQAGL